MVNIFCTVKDNIIRAKLHHTEWGKKALLSMYLVQCSFLDYKKDWKHEYQEKFTIKEHGILRTEFPKDEKYVLICWMLLAF